jgi:class 3 adenylate cyclase
VVTFLRVGLHQSNVSGYTSKAWTIARVGSSVELKGGAVEVRGIGRARRIYWESRPRQKTIRCGSEKLALDYVKKAVARRIGHRYERLLDTARIRPRPVRRRVDPGLVLVTVLFVDIVRSTEKAALLGDRRWNDVLSHCYAALRRALRASRGREITTTGDGLVATFDGPSGATRAIRCAASIQKAVRTLGLEIRTGLHAGECELVEDSVRGIAFHIGARVMAKAGADEVLVSSAVKDLAAEAGIKYEDRGVHRLKGVPKGWRLYRVLQA